MRIPTLYDIYTKSRKTLLLCRYGRYQYKEMMLTDVDPNNSHDGQMKVQCIIQTIREDQHRLLRTSWRLSFIRTREISPPTSTARVIQSNIDSYLGPGVVHGTCDPWDVVTRHLQTI